MTAKSKEKEAKRDGKARDTGLSVGARLRNERLAKNFSIEDAYKATKIHMDILEALEDDKLEAVLSPVYVKAFIKTYAQFLGLDAKEVLREFDGAARPAQVVPDAKADERSGGRRESSEMYRVLWSVIVYTFSLLLILLIVTSAAMRIASYIKSKLPKHAAPLSHENILQPKPPETRNKVVQPATAAQTPQPAPKEGGIKLAVSTVADVWMRVKVDGAVVFYRILPKNSRETWTADERIDLEQIGKPEALRLTLNGKPIDPARSKNSRNIAVTREGAQFDNKNRGR